MRGNGRLQPIPIRGGSLLKSIHLMGAPKARGELLGKSKGLVHPVRLFLFRCYLEVREITEDLAELLRGKRPQVVQFTVESSALRGKLVVILN